MSGSNGSVLTQENDLSFVAGNVTGSQAFDVTVQRTQPAEDVARSVAEMMALPDNVPYALRDDSSSAYLRDQAPIGDQLAPGARVTLTPKTHLGGPCGL